MTVIDYENIYTATTENWSSGPSSSDQSSPTTRRISAEAFFGELETLAIEHNRDFYATILERLHVERPVLIDAADVVAE